MTNIIIGIDPGKGGGMAVIRLSDDYFTAASCPETIDEMSEFIRTIKSETHHITCFLEKVHAFPTDGRSSAFKFGMNYGIWRGILSAFSIKTELITPQSWQKYFGKLPKIKQERKNKLKEIATKESNIKATLKTADAICIAVYGKEILKEGEK